MTDRLLLDLASDGVVTAGIEPSNGLYEQVSRTTLAWPLDREALEDLRWYLEDYLQAPFGVWEDRGPVVREKLAVWGKQIFECIFDNGPARFSYERARDRGLELVFRSSDPDLLSLPWELMRDPAGPVALGAGGISRSLPVADGAGTLEVPGGRLRVLMVISRPAGTSDVGYQMVARPLLERLKAVRGEVELTVLRPPTFDTLRDTILEAADAGAPFHVVHFDGHGAMPGRISGSGGAVAAVRPNMMSRTGEGVLAFEKPNGGSDLVGASKIAAVLAGGKVPVAVLNACQSGAMGKQLEASVAAALLRATGCAAVVAMAYSVYAVAAAEFMAAFYESLFAGATVSQAVTVGRRRLFEHDGRPSPKGDMRLADWLVPVHYLRRDVSFPQARTTRSAAAPSLDDELDQIRAAPREAAAQDPLAPATGVFVGRDDLFYQLEAAARLQRVVVLSGPGGTGKTELAKGFARWWRDTGGVDDPRLVLWHSFEPGVATFGLDEVITSIGMEVLGANFARLDPPERLAAIKQLLGRYRCLLVWDNFESVADMPDTAGVTPPLDETGRAELREFLHWVRVHSASTVIVTSRTQENWLGDVHRITVDGLNHTEAAEYAGLLLAPFPTARQRRKRRSFGELLDWLDGHPLAMRLTLPRLENTDPAALLNGLRGTDPLPAKDSGPGRLSSLGACITYSFAHLTEQARRLLPALSLFHGIADENVLVAFSAVEGTPPQFAGTSREEWKAGLQEASQVGLLADIDGFMYRIHPALPAYLAAEWHAGNPGGYDRERQASEQALRAAYADFSRWLTVQIHSGNAALAYILIGLHGQTLGAMLGHAMAHHAWDEAGAIFQVLEPYWETRGLAGESDAWADRILDTTAGPGQAPGESARSLWLYATISQASHRSDAGQPDRAEHAYRRALAYLQTQPESEWTRSSIACLYHQLGITFHQRGRLEEADDWYRQSLAIKEEVGDRPGMASTYHHLGASDEARGRLEEADEWYRQSLAINEGVGNRPGMAMTYHQLGTTAYQRGRPEEADEWYRQSLAISEELGDRRSMALTYAQLGLLSEDRGQASLALTWNIRCVTLFSEFPSPITGSGPESLIRLTDQLGIPALEQAWQEVTGQPLPPYVRNYVTCHPDQEQPGGQM